MLSLALLLTLLFFGASVSAQTTTKIEKPDEQKCEQIIKRAIEVYGGSKYLGVKTVIGRGFFTQFRAASLNCRRSSSTTSSIPTRSERNSSGGGVRVYSNKRWRWRVAL